MKSDINNLYHECGLGTIDIANKLHIHNRTVLENIENKQNKYEKRKDFNIKNKVREDLLDGLSIEQISERWDLPIGKVKQLYRTLKNYEFRTREFKEKYRIGQKVKITTYTPKQKKVGKILDIITGKILIDNGRYKECFNINDWVNRDIKIEVIL